MANPQSQSDVDPNFEQRIRDLQSAAQSEYAGRTGTGQVLWNRPGGWTGDLFDLDAMHTPFDRTKANTDFLTATKDPENPGTTGDVVVTTTMIDYLAQMESAFRVRHTYRRPRAMALMLGRRQGHASEQGPLIESALEYVRALLVQAKRQG